MYFDTNLYITAIHYGESSFAYQSLFENLPRTYLSSVISAELHAGCTDDIGLQLVKQYTRRIEKTGRIVTPAHATWNKAGILIAKIIKDSPNYKSKAAVLLNDILIALSAIQIGGTVYTANKEDFLLIRRYRSFSLQFIIEN
ncbi:MAG: type II toxin-antitoxin system VapC family toxin [Nitrospirae bacterium]|nr:type II toxin-antitoxin system VapC family toxin [Nitrospirota bacterium]